jgi:hypothetical protein
MRRRDAASSALLFDRRIEALPVAVEAGEDDHLRREREVPLDFAQRPPASLRRGREHARDGDESQSPGEHEPCVACGLDLRQREPGGGHREHKQYRRYHAQPHFDPPSDRSIVPPAKSDNEHLERFSLEQRPVAVALRSESAVSPMRSARREADNGST